MLENNPNNVLEEIEQGAEKLEREKKREEVLRHQIIGASRDFHMLYNGLLVAQKIEQTNNDSAENFSSMQDFSRLAAAQVASIMDSLVGTNRTPGAPNSLEDVVKDFPNTPLGEVPIKYGLRQKVEELLNKLSQQEHPVDVVLP